LACLDWLMLGQVGSRDLGVCWYVFKWALSFVVEAVRIAMALCGDVGFP